MSVVIKDVPLVQTGIEYPVSTGKVTFTEEDLADMVLAQNDPAIVSPRIKLGHEDPRFNNPSHDGDPAFGTIKNLHLSDNKQIVLGDYTDMPDWLGTKAAQSFPNRSIEGNFDVETVTGRKYRFVITDVALLGVTWPGISTLDDLQAAISDEGPREVVMGSTVQAVTSQPWDGSASRFSDQQYASSCVLDRAKCDASWSDKPAKSRYSLPVKEPGGELNSNAVHAAAGRLNQTNACPAAKSAAAKSLLGYYKQLGEDPPDSLKSVSSALAIAASVNVENVMRKFYDEVATSDTGRYWWWVRSVLVDPNELIVDDDEGGLHRIEFSTDSEGNVSFNDPQTVEIEEFTDMPVAAAAQVTKAKVAVGVYASSRESRPTQRENPVSAVTLDLPRLRQLFGLPDDATEEQINAEAQKRIEASANQPPPSEPQEVPEVPPPNPDGTVTVDSATLATLRANADLGVQAFERQRVTDRDNFLRAAVIKGKFPPSRVEHWAQAWEAEYEALGNADGIKGAIEGMPEGLIPVGSIGTPGDNEGIVTTSEAYPKHWLPEVHNPRPRQTITQE